MFKIILVIYIISIVPFGWKIALIAGILIDFLIKYYCNKEK